MVPELRQIRAESAEIRSTLQVTNKRLDDLHTDLVDQSRRIDAIRAELTAHLDETNKRIDDTNDRLNRLYEVIVRRDEQERLAQRLARLEQKVEDLTGRLAV